MRFVTIILSCWTVILLTSFSQQVSKRLLWSESRKLVWSDFQGKQDKRVIDKMNLPQDQVIITDTDTTKIHVESEAYCSHQIQFNSRGLGQSITYEVKTYFDPAHSWTQTSSEYVLNHEQRHFDLAEVCARKFRKYLADSVSTINQKELQKVFNRFHLEDMASQEAYDSITNHSINRDEQIRYDHDIDSMLLLYVDYANTQVKKTLTIQKSNVK